jgi:hypothetical protein
VEEAIKVERDVAMQYRYPIVLTPPRNFLMNIETKIWLDITSTGA